MFSVKVGWSGAHYVTSMTGMYTVSLASDAWALRSIKGLKLAESATFKAHKWLSHYSVLVVAVE